MQTLYRLDGVGDLRAQLQRLTPRMQSSVMRPAMLAGARFIRQAVRLAAPRGETGNLKRGVAVEAARLFDPLEPVVEIGWKRRRAGGSHAHLVEYGTAKRRTRKGANRGQARAFPFFAEAVSLAHAGAAHIIRMVWAARLAAAAEAAKKG